MTEIHAQYYTLALERLSTKEISVTRTLLASRSQANLRAGNFHDALNDCNLVLSSPYGTTDEDKILTAQAYLRRAYVRQTLTLYPAAQQDYIRSETLHAELGISISPPDRKIVQLIEADLAISPDSEEMNRIKLIRAVEVSVLCSGVPSTHIDINNDRLVACSSVRTTGAHSLTGLVFRLTHPMGTKKRFASRQARLGWII